MLDSVSLTFQVKEKINTDDWDKMIFVRATGEYNEVRSIRKRFTYTYKNADCIGNVLFKNSLKVVGSVAKALRGDNINNYRVNDIDKFIQIIEEDVNCKVSHLMKIGRVDVGINTGLNTRSVISSIINVNARLKERLYDSTLLLHNKQRQFCIYDKAKEQNRKDKQVCRFESRVFKTKNLYKFNISTIEDVFDISKQKYMFLNQLNKNFNFEVIVSSMNEDVTIKDIKNVFALKAILKEFKTLSNYRDYLIKDRKFNRNNASAHIRVLKKYLYVLEKETFIDVRNEIDKELKKLEI